MKDVFATLWYAFVVIGIGGAIGAVLFHVWDFVSGLR